MNFGTNNMLKMSGMRIHFVSLSLNCSTGIKFDLSKNKKTF